MLAGPNGVGKTNILTALLGLAQNPHANAAVWMIVEATSDEERNRWNKNALDSRRPEDAALLRTQLQRNQRRNQYQGSFLNFDSDRAVRNVQAFNFSWDIGNPLQEDVGWNVGFTQMHSRYNEVRHSLFRLVESQRREIAESALKMRSEGRTEMALDFPDVLAPFKEAFRQLLAPKELKEANIREQQIYYELNGQRLTLESLSSGEKEVVNIVFDFLLRGPKDCVVVFDEPELHLHPELSYKLLQALSAAGLRNQFIFSTHSPEIISASLENTVVFITPPRDDSNQAVIVHRDDETHHALQALGQSIGVISLGKKLVLIEGDEASLDKQTYGAILKGRFPEFVLVPAGGKDTIRSFDDIRDNILSKTIWGVSFYMLCDRDALHTLGNRPEGDVSSSRIRQLSRYHLENYFLDEQVLAKVFSTMEAPGSWLRNPTEIGQSLRKIAKASIPYAVALNVAATLRRSVGNIGLMPKGLDKMQSANDLIAAMEDKAETERARVMQGLDKSHIANLVSLEFARLEGAIVAADSAAWNRDLPGRVILHRFAAEAGMQPGRLKQLYLAACEPEVQFADVIDSFHAFRADAS